MSTSATISHAPDANRQRRADCAPPLTAKLAPWMQTFIERKGLAAELTKTYGSPLHIVVKSEFERNVRDLLQPLSARNLRGSLSFARKANKLPWFVTAARDAGIGVDTASFREIEETIELGVSPEKIIVTAVGKDRRIVEKAIASGCLIVIDNDDELQLVKYTSSILSKVARIGLRFSGFELEERIVYSRFGFPIADAQAVIEAACDVDTLSLELLHAHLDRYDAKERGTAAHQLVEVADLAKRFGHDIRSIDIGGGILMRYLDQPQQWHSFLSELKESVAGTRVPFTYQNDGFGYRRSEQSPGSDIGKSVSDSGSTKDWSGNSANGNVEVVGQPDLYPMWNDISKERFILAVLDHQVDGVTLHKALSDRDIALYFEPGRALLDNTGISLAEVRFRKFDTTDNLLIGVGMNRMNLRPFRAEFCSDPIMLVAEPRKAMTRGAFVVGLLCSESDFIFKRRIQFSFMPEPGDTMCFINSAGYLAHHMEIGTHGDPLPTNLLLNPETLNIEEVFQ